MKPGQRVLLLALLRGLLTGLRRGHGGLRRLLEELDVRVEDVTRAGEGEDRCGAREHRQDCAQDDDEPPPVPAWTLRRHPMEVSQTPRCPLVDLLARSRRPPSPRSRARTPSTWSAAPCATCCWSRTPHELDFVVEGDAVPVARRAAARAGGEVHRPRPLRHRHRDHARGDLRSRGRTARALRAARRAAGGRARRLPARGPRAARLHGQRDRPAPGRRRADLAAGRRGGPARRAAACPPRRVVPRRPDAPAAPGPLRRPPRVRTGGAHRSVGRRGGRRRRGRHDHRLPDGRRAAAAAAGAAAGGAAGARAPRAGAGAAGTIQRRSGARRARDRAVPGRTAAPTSSRSPPASAATGRRSRPNSTSSRSRPTSATIVARAASSARTGRRHRSTRSRPRPAIRSATPTSGGAATRAAGDRRVGRGARAPPPRPGAGSTTFATAGWPSPATTSSPPGSPARRSARRSTRRWWRCWRAVRTAVRSSSPPP